MFQFPGFLVVYVKPRPQNLSSISDSGLFTPQERTMKNADALSLAQAANSNVVKVTSIRSIARLWAGMGHIQSLTCQTKDKDNVEIIAKQISCPNPRSFGDKRKAASYHVEANFYEKHSSTLHDQGICCQGLHVANDGRGEISILMTPLPHHTLHYMSGDTADAAIRSVARLHAYFWGVKADEAVEEGGLAPQGCYWYLDTRPDEFESMSNRGVEGMLKRAARAIDEKLKSNPYQTVCHGDLKACNMSLSTDTNYVTLVDFQYVGKACFAKDLAYLFVCGMDVDSDFEERQEEAYLNLYLKELQKNGVQRDELPSLEEAVHALDLAYCDLYRWMCGWGVWGNGFLSDRVERCLDQIL